uniref:Uncharacterized protein n=1 Tax=Anopheles albimanus TaxID=7167 RepID=A0A182FXZ1_ANOAL
MPCVVRVSTLCASRLPAAATQRVLCRLFRPKGKKVLLRKGVVDTSIHSVKKKKKPPG